MKTKVAAKANKPVLKVRDMKPRKDAKGGKQIGGVKYEDVKASP